MKGINFFPWPTIDYGIGRPWIMCWFFRAWHPIKEVFLNDAHCVQVALKVFKVEYIKWISWKWTLPEMFQAIKFSFESRRVRYVVLQASGIQYIVTAYIVMNKYFFFRRSILEKTVILSFWYQDPSRNSNLYNNPFAFLVSFGDFKSRKAFCVGFWFVIFNIRLIITTDTENLWNVHFIQWISYLKNHFQIAEMSLESSIHTLWDFIIFES